MQNFKSSTASVIEFCFFMKMKKRIRENHVYLYFIPCVIFSSMQVFYTFSTLTYLEEIESLFPCKIASPLLLWFLSVTSLTSSCIVMSVGMACIC